jgi:Mg-chelatase subunit ChlD
VADLTATDEAATTLTVTAGPTVAVTGKVITVRGRDAKGNTGQACLYLPERTTGGLTITSGLRKDRKPTKSLEIILDASGSMKALLGKKTRWATAQEVLADVVAKLPADYHVGLRTYGHREPSTSPKTCTDTELVVPVGPLDRARLLAAAKALKPRGETPLVYSALQTPADLKGSAGGIVVLITDGEESCKGDFAAATKTLKESGLDVMLNIVGFTLKNVQAQADLKTLAESTGGRYYSAQNGAQLSRALLLAAVDQIPYRVLDAKGTEVTQGVAGVGGTHELPPGDYAVVLTAGDESLKVPVSLALRQDVALRVVITDDKLAVEK